MWIIDFGTSMAENEASLYEAPFEYVLANVRPDREKNPREAYRRQWWLHVEPRSGMRAALAGMPRFLATMRTAKHRVFVWLDPRTLPDSQLIVFALDDDYSMGVLQSSVHETWARATGTQLREAESGFRYTPTTCFETFPFPTPTSAQHAAIASAAKRLDALRRGWLLSPPPPPPPWQSLDADRHGPVQRQAKLASTGARGVGSRGRSVIRVRLCHLATGVARETRRSQPQSTRRR